MYCYVFSSVVAHFRRVGLLFPPPPRHSRPFPRQNSAQIFASCPFRIITRKAFRHLPPRCTTTMSSLSDLVPAGVITGDDVLTLFDHARTNGYAIPAVNCTRYVRFEQRRRRRRRRPTRTLTTPRFIESVSLAREAVVALREPYSFPLSERPWLSENHF